MFDVSIAGSKQLGLYVVPEEVKDRIYLFAVDILNPRRHWLFGVLRWHKGGGGGGTNPARLVPN